MDRILGFTPVDRVVKKAQPVSPTVYEQEYLLGVRGLLVIESFIWVFLQTFVPAAVVDSDHDGKANGPLYQVILRKTLSSIFWNENLLYASFIFLSARSIAIPFIREPTRARVAGTVFRRGITLWFPVAVALAIVKLALPQPYLNYIFQFKAKTGNTSFAVPYFIPNAFAYFNSVFDLFWTTHNYPIQSGSTAFPSQTLWIVNAIYQQSYTIYVTMIIIPYTRNKWRVQGAFFFIITAWWVQSWAWFSITGLIIADMVMNMDFKAKAQRGIPLLMTSRRCPTWVPATIVLVAGVLMQYLWTAWRPSLVNEEYLIHTGMYYTPGLNTKDDGRYPQARDDNYLFLLGFFLLLESSDMLQWIFSNRVFKFLGRRSLSMLPHPHRRAHYSTILITFLGFFLIQSTMIYIVGIRVFMHLRYKKDMSFPGSTIVTLITCLAVVIPAAEAFHWLVEKPSKLLAHKSFEWITD